MYNNPVVFAIQIKLNMLDKNSLLIIVRLINIKKLTQRYLEKSKWTCNQYC